MRPACFEIYIPMKCSPGTAVTRIGRLLACVLIFLSGCSERSADEQHRYPGMPQFPAVTPLSQQNPGVNQPANASPAITISTIPQFREVQNSLGVSFVYQNGAGPEKRIVESTGGGAAWLDVDADDFPDLYLVQGGSPLTADMAKNPGDRLYRNRNGIRFYDATAPAGIDERRYGQGIAVGDFDGDGFDDVYVTNVGPDAFYQNQGDGTFRDISFAVSRTGAGWGSSTAWADLDGDGDLDLFVCQYLNYDPDSPIRCVDREGKPRICHPSEVDPQSNFCLRNEGDGRFTDVLKEWGLDGPGSKSLGLVIADLNGDHLVDVFVANDTTANHLFLQRGQGDFVERGRSAGVAVDGLGRNQASMGAAFGDYDQDGLPDLHVTHFTQEYNTLYRGMQDGVFVDMTPVTGLLHPTLSLLGFGTVMMDFNCDGYSDLMVANGHIDASFVHVGDRFRMPAQLFSYNGNQWEQLSEKAGDYFQSERIGRAIATADYDNDGDADVVIINQNAAAVVLENSARQGHGLKIRFAGQWGNRRGIGTEARVSQGDRRWIQQLAGGTSYCASHQPALFFGLGNDDADCSIEVRWPDGRQSVKSGVQVDQEIVFRETDAR